MAYVVHCGCLRNYRHLLSLHIHHYRTIAAAAVFFMHGINFTATTTKINKQRHKRQLVSKLILKLYSARRGIGWSGLLRNMDKLSQVALEQQLNNCEISGV